MPLPGEVEALTRLMHPAAGPEIAAMGGMMAPPSPHAEWWIHVVCAGDVIVRLLTVREKGAALMPSKQTSAAAVMIGDRVAVDARRS